MATKARSIAIWDLETNWASVVDEVAATGEPVILTKAGEAIAKLVPIKRARPLLGSVLWEGDIVSPIDESWDADS